MCGTVTLLSEGRRWAKKPRRPTVPGHILSSRLHLTEGAGGDSGLAGKKVPADATVAASASKHLVSVQTAEKNARHNGSV